MNKLEQSSRGSHLTLERYRVEQTVTMETGGYMRLFPVPYENQTRNFHIKNLPKVIAVFIGLQDC